jgi:hypothetical protein
MPDQVQQFVERNEGDKDNGQDPPWRRRGQVFARERIRVQEGVKDQGADENSHQQTTQQSRQEQTRPGRRGADRVPTRFVGRWTGRRRRFNKEDAQRSLRERGSV